MNCLALTAATGGIIVHLKQGRSGLFWYPGQAPALRMVGQSLSGHLSASEEDLG